jgi:UDP:flavonoid glycosyltransferase YjiC (YdhE family)
MNSLRDVRTPARKKILFVSECVTLAQVVRLVVLAQALDPTEYEVHFASAEFDPLVFSGTHFVQHHLETIDKHRLMAAMDAGKRLYEKSTLKRYVAAELDLFEKVEPALVIGDFRLSLSVSAPLAKVPYASLINAYWSPYAEREGFPVPDHPIVRLLGEEMTERYFPMALPHVFDHFAAPVNALRKKYGLSPLGSLLEVLTAGDATLYVDDPELVPLRADAPPSHQFLGPVLWSPEVPLPASLRSPSVVPLVYVTLGSSGRTDVLPAVLEALGGMNVRVVVATAGRAELTGVPANVECFDFVPGAEVARRAALVVSNGGSTTSYQALAEGTPVLGLPSNFDQYLAMTAIERAGAGILVKARQANATSIRAAVSRLLGEPSFRRAAGVLAERTARLDSGAAFRRFVARALAGTPRAEATPPLRSSVG